MFDLNSILPLLWCHLYNLREGSPTAIHCIKSEDFHARNDIQTFFTIRVVLVVHYHIISYKIKLENFEPNSPLNVYWWHCWSHTMYTDKKEAWIKVMKIKLRGVVIVIPLKFEVWHLKFGTIPFFSNVMDLWHDISFTFPCNHVTYVCLDIIILTWVPDDLL